MTAQVMVIAPHPDDESIGCGGTIRLHRERGEQVQVVFLTSGERGIRRRSVARARAVREAEAGEALRVLGVQQKEFLRLPDLGVADHLKEGASRLEVLLRAGRPGIVYLPHPDEAHPDHRAALPLVRTALKQLDGSGAATELRGYEVWSPLTAHGWAEDITRHMARKLRAVRCYRSQLADFRYDRAVRGLDEYRGCMAARCRYAEVFQHFPVRDDS